MMTCASCGGQSNGVALGSSSDCELCVLCHFPLAGPPQLDVETTRIILAVTPELRRIAAALEALNRQIGNHPSYA